MLDVIQMNVHDDVVQLCNEEVQFGEVGQFGGDFLLLLLRKRLTKTSLDHEERILKKDKNTKPD